MCGVEANHCMCEVEASHCMCGVKASHCRCGVEANHRIMCGRTGARLEGGKGSRTTSLIDSRMVTQVISGSECGP
eukprot:183614-Chlamydomonas_euryale.AAC.1